MANAGKSCASCGGNYGSEVLFCPLDGTPLSSSRTLTASPNEIDPYLFLELAGQIQLNALVGIGSMGRVYRAFQSGVDRDVAVKILHRELTGNAELVQRFHREAKIASRLVHPNVVQVLMTGTLPHAADKRTGGEVYLVMEYLDGISLLSALAAQGEGGALPLARTLHVILQLCEAVGEAHANNIVHRDLKPENIMLIRRAEDPDFVKVLDFGIARLDSAIEGSTTQAGLIFGTAKYISPEGAEGKHVGPQADVYAIATILYQCLAGRTPFQADSPMALLVQQIHGTPTDLRSVPRAAYVPESISRVVMGNLSKDPEERSENARAFARELSLAARDAGLHLDTMHGGAPRGDLRLLSKQRTRQHEFSPELKAKIASMPSASASGNGAKSVAFSAADAVRAGAARPITTYEEVPSDGFRSAPPAPPPPGHQNGSNGVGTNGHANGLAAVAPSRPAPTQIAPRAAKTQLADDVDTGEQNGLLYAPQGPGHTQFAVEDITISGTLSVQDAPLSLDHRHEEEDAPKPGYTIPGAPLNGHALLAPGAVGTEPLAADDGPTATGGEDVEGPIDSDPAPRASVPSPRASNPNFVLAPPSGAPPGSSSRPGASRPGASQPGAGGHAAANGALSVAAAALNGMAAKATSTPPAASSRGQTQVSKSPPPLPAEDAPPVAVRSADPTLTEPVVKKPKFSDEVDETKASRATPVAWKTLALIAIIFVLVPVGIAGAKMFSNRAADTQSYDATLEAAVAAKDKRAWDAPPGQNVKELTDKLLEQSPGDLRVLRLRENAAGQIVVEALGEKSKNRAEALRLFRLALELNPNVDGVKAEIAALEGTTASATAASATTQPVPDPQPEPPSSIATGPTAKVSGKLPTAKPSASSRPGSTSTVAPKPSSTSDSILPLPDFTSPPPKDTSSSGPWL